jgi:hypothetical protein
LQAIQFPQPAIGTIRGGICQFSIPGPLGATRNCLMRL